MLDTFSLSILRLFRIGPWFCVHCDNKVYLLPGNNRNALDYRSSALGNEELTSTQWKKSSTSQTDQTSGATAQAPAPIPAVAAPIPAVPVGNFLKSEQSLSNRASRLERFSQKYRDAVVRRILVGSTTISQVRQDKHLSEGEVAEWIADLFERRGRKIKELERIVESLSQARIIAPNSGDSKFETTVDSHNRPR